MLRVLGLAATFAAFATMTTAATVGSFTFDDDAFADEASIFSGTGNGFVASAADGDLGTEFQLNMNTNDPAQVAFAFTDNELFNGTGIDIIAFGDNNNGVLRMGLADTPSSVTAGVFLGVFSAGQEGALFGGGIYGWDLDDFGFAAGEAYTSGLIIAPQGIFSRVYDIAALNSRAPTPDIGAVPLPAGLPLLLAGLGGFVALRRRTLH